MEQIDLNTFLVDFYEDIVYDGSPKLPDYVSTGIWFSLLEDDCIAGFINVEPLNNVMYSPHIFIYKSFRGNKSEDWGLQVAEYMRKNLGAKKFLAFTPYLSALRYAKKIGFKQIAILTKSIQKNGLLLDQYVLELGEPM